MARRAKAQFDVSIAEAEHTMIRRNKDGKSRARCSPSGIPYTLLYPSTQTQAVTMRNMGMTGRGIP